MQPRGHDRRSRPSPGRALRADVAPAAHVPPDSMHSTPPLLPASAPHAPCAPRRQARPLFALLLLLIARVSAPAASAVDFQKEVEPILIKRCSECHGSDKQKARLRLDSRAAALLAGESGHPAVVPGRPDESEILKRVASSDPDEVMPPKGNRLTAAEIASLRAWVAEGAVWPEADPRKFWAFVPLGQPAPPTPPAGAWGRNEIDRFILSRLQKEGLTPRGEADRPTLLRRVHLDLTGLPPTPAEVEEFVLDSSPDAYERRVDALLASPHYGEHMARGWLDLARYADSNGYQVDLARYIWPYREWVIRAFNQNMPFDRFTLEQLAGDLLPNPTLDQRIATGFNRNTKINDEGGGDAEEYRVKAVKDRVATLGTTWLGLTLNCAECHSHKYDPISQEEYYQLYAFFNNTTDGGNHNTAPSVKVPAPDLSDSTRFVTQRLAQVRSGIEAATKALPAAQHEWEKSILRKGEIWHVLQLTNAYSNGGSSYTNLPDGSVLGFGVNPIYDTITVEATTDLTGVTAVLLEVLPDPSLPKGGPGRWGASGNFILDEFSLSALPAAGPRPAETNLFFSRATADWEQLYYRAEHAIDRNPKTGWAIGPRFGQRHFLIAELERPGGYKGGTKLSFRFDQYHGSSHCIGRFRISVTTEKDPAALWPVPAEIRQIAAIRASLRTREQSSRLAGFYREASPGLRGLERERIRLEERAAELASPQFTTLVVQERSEPQPRQTYVHVRGDFLTHGKEVAAGVPAIFPPLAKGQAADRLALARWLVDPAHPLTARVTVNRFWERCFGTGIVKTSEDFGRQGEAPSHPELLDWLAAEFIRSGWDVKRMQRLIVASSTYRQDAAVDPARLEKDFYNRLLSRGPRFRMDAEMIRDHALAVSGLLNPKVGGPSVYPRQIPNLWKEIGFLRPEIGMDEWPASEGPDLYRRGIYTFWRRVCTYPTFSTFDAPSREICVSRRPRTNTPLQALAALNDPAFIEAARVFAERILTEGGNDSSSQLEFAVRLCLGRAPTGAEKARLLSFLDQQLAGYRNDLRAAESLVSIGPAPRNPALDVRRLAAWTMLANVLFNLDETLTKG